MFYYSGTGFQDCSGWHSGQGSITPGITKEISLRTKHILRHWDRLLAQNFDARLAGIVIWSDRPYLEKIPGGLKSLKNHKIRKIHVPNIQAHVFFLRSPKRRRQLRHSHGVFGGERARHSHIQQVYRHPTSIQAPYKYTEILQVYSIQNTSPDIQIQVQTPKYKSRHKKQVQTPQIHVQTPKIHISGCM